MDDEAMAPIASMRPIELEHSDFEEWCSCVRRLLGWTDGVREEWRAMFASGHTPRDAARAAVYGDSRGD